MRSISAEDIDRVLNRAALVETLAEAFRSEVVTPVRHHHPIARAGEPEAMLLLMPAWDAMDREIRADAVMGVKIVSVVPGNAARDVPSVVGAYLLLSGVTGAPLAILDGTRLTLWRTAAASALAATHLARPDASRLVVVGAGALARHLAEAHASARPIRDIKIWNRSGDKAAAMAAELAAKGYAATATDDLAAAVREADIVTAATMSKTPIIEGAWLKPGAHVDLVGGFTPEMREADDTAVRRARVFVDTRAGALKEAGDVVDPIRRGVIAEGDIAGDLFGLCRGAEPGRGSADEITLFKSVGTALEDLAAARLVWTKTGG